MGIWGWAGHPHSKGEVAILLENKALAFIAFSRPTCVGSAGIWMCSHCSCFAVTAEVWTLGSKPEEAVTCLPCLRAAGVIYVDLQITALLGFHLTALICWLFYFPYKIFG